ncbi:ABC transporter ATP-binding protein [Corynebacterium coyleae]|uniref:ABC transporter ATP-binding protein n=1 Tax=Corynebacterium coyleae TaxID=53374 RepID=UPI00254E1FA5|nr:ABC transporter ATP-binding protein [Corynebacterium coyleae]MDK8663267.1 ABC transporter ATP-binding protein [Corynebacterium coyleae]MDK8706387.1 ABC transporter ATP-binding protein [Corynebacterium coyleae]MDK8733222.1 ABC transporter ATP-binding protein [Corynebacterium coyleae]MDK8892429.1 ABC transporter ATP-binding protein [Corynebacterium coyleae]
METPMIQTHGLTKTYGRTDVVHNLDLKVAPGVVHGLLGPNGSGKSTTMKMLLGLIAPTHGDISVLGHPMTRANRAHVLAGVGSLIEAPVAYPHLTGGENMRIVTRLLGADPEAVRRAVSLVRLEGQMDKLVKNYSLGMKQRLGIAMALARDPQLLILDEPTNGLDPAGIEEIRELIISLARDQGRTVLVSSHLLSEIEKMATDLTIINHGKLVFQGSQDELYSAQLPDVFIQTPDAATAVSVLRALQPKRVEGGVELSGLDDDHLAHTIALLVTHGVPLHQVLRKRRSLEDIFIGLTNDEVASA